MRIYSQRQRDIRDAYRLTWRLLVYAIIACSVVPLGSRAQTAHQKIRSSLVAITSSGETETGQPVGTQGTGFFITVDGYVLTSYHLLDLKAPLPDTVKKDPVKPQSVTLLASVSEKSAPQRKAKHMLLMRFRTWTSFCLNYRKRLNRIPRPNWVSPRVSRI